MTTQVYVSTDGAGEAVVLELQTVLIRQFLRATLSPDEARVVAEELLTTAAAVESGRAAADLAADHTLNQIRGA